MSDAEKDRAETSRSSELRARVGEYLSSKKASADDPAAGADVRSLAHELQVQQVELQMQNEELLRAEAVARETADRYQSLVDGADIGIAMIDSEHNLVMINTTQAVMGRGNPSELVGKKCFRVMGGRDAVCPHCPGVVAMATGSPAEAVVSMAMEDGGVRDFRLKASPIFDRAGRATAFVEIIVDITELKRAEREIASLARLPSEDPNPILRVDAAGAVFYSNRPGAQLLEMSGCSQEDAIPGPWRRLVLETLGSGSIRQTQWICEDRVFALTFVPVSDAGYVNLFALDVTDRKRAEDSIRASEAKYRRLYETMRDAFVSVGMDGRIQECNGAYLEMLGYDYEEIYKLTYFDLTPEKWHAMEAEIVAQQILPRGYSDVYEKQYRRKDGTVFPVELRTFLLTDDSREPRGMWATVRDITERKRAEELLERGKVAAEAANRAKSEFLANMSHEIRTPMTAILGFSELLSSPNLAYDEQREFLQGIRKNGKALLELINDILDLSRIEADRVILEKVDYPLMQIIDEVMPVVRGRAEQRGLCLEVDYRFPLPATIHTDPIRLRQILVNLVGNAVKFTKQGGVRVTVSCSQRHDERLQMQFAVSDTGIGIPADRIGDLFQPFTQVDGSASREYGGTGLGLAISKRLAEALGGRIEVASELGKWSTFTLSIDAGEREGVPVLQTLPADVPADVPAVEQPDSESHGPTIEGRVLLAEDVPDIQKVIAQVLQRFGLIVDVAKDGRVACDMAERSKAEGSPYGLILMDIQMAEMNGYEATRWLRQHGWKGPIVALTAHAMVGDREKGLAAGCDDYITKPVTAAGLRDILLRTMGRAVAAAGSVGTAQETVAAPAGLLDGGLLDAAKVAQMVEAFIAEAPRRAGIIEEALAGQDRRLLAELAHQLKGTAGVFGFPRVAEIAEVIHRAATEQEGWQQIQADVAELVLLCGQLSAKPLSSASRS